MESLRELYKVGNGPSSSHTMGPARAAKVFMGRYPEATSYEAVLYGSLAATGEGHLTDYIIIGFRICLPVFASILLMNIVLGLLAKLAPQMNMFSVGIQLKLLAGLSVLFLTIGMLPNICDFISTQIQQMLVAIVEGMM